ncbi:hypothetical protein [Ramlibacter pallidus]|uniref:Uncharacterized protein n=1 Tax=Ramlibacter pallidus TaxID=2780087 RepID=A0ABR9S5H0_9BURK|nr:hypothetical protein [Ramlibacter pallidus]MBE7368684.1 hypothetical protein [Ramlibacter pallidus]
MNGLTVFVRTAYAPGTLEKAALEVFRALGLAEHEERLSSNYPPDEHYYVGYAENAVVEVFDMDDVKEGYPYGVAFETPTYRKGSERLPEDLAVLVALLAAAPLRVFVPEGRWWSKEWNGGGKEHAV